MNFYSNHTFMFFTKRNDTRLRKTQISPNAYFTLTFEYLIVCNGKIDDY